MKTKFFVLIPLLLLLVALAMQGAAAAGVYNAGDIEVIHRIIDDNDLDWEKWTDGDMPPASWHRVDKKGSFQEGVQWSDDATSKRIVSLSVYDKGLTGTLDVSGLTELKWLGCSKNKLIAFDISKCVKLEWFECADNNLSTLDATRCTKLAKLECDGNPLSHLKLPGGYQVNIVVVPQGSGTVRLTEYNHDKKRVTLSAKAMEGSAFSGWTVSGFPTKPRTRGSSVVFTLPPTTVTVTANFQ